MDTKNLCRQNDGLAEAAVRSLDPKSSQAVDHGAYRNQPASQHYGTVLAEMGIFSPEVHKTGCGTESEGH